MLTLNNFKEKQDTYTNREVAEDLGIVVGGTYLGNKLGRSNLAAKLTKSDKKSNQKALKNNIQDIANRNNNYRKQESNILKNQIKQSKQDFLEEASWVKQDYKDNKSKLTSKIRNLQNKSKRHTDILKRASKTKLKQNTKYAINIAKDIKRDLVSRSKRLANLRGRIGMYALPAIGLGVANEVRKRKQRNDKGKLRGNYNK